MAELRLAKTDQQLLLDALSRIDQLEFARAIAEAFREQIPYYQRMSDLNMAAEVKDVARTTIEAFHRGVLEQRPPNETDLAPLRAAARMRANEEMPLEELLQAYRTGGRLAWEALADAAMPHEQPALIGGAALMMEYVDHVSTAIAQAYVDERSQLVSEEDRRLRELLHDLSVTRTLSVGSQRLAETLSIPILQEYRAFAAVMRDGGAREHSRVAAALRARGVLAVNETGLLVGVAAPDRTRGLIGQPAVIAVSEPTQRGRLGPALDEARSLAKLGRILGYTGEIAPDDFLPELLLAVSPRLAVSLRRKVLGPLEDYSDRRGADLLETLAEFVRCECDRRQTATSLHVHPNTVDYRLGRVEELTSLRLGNPYDLQLITLALTQRQLGNDGVY